MLLIASRVVQGAGAAVVARAAFSLITTGFAEGPRRNRALGRYGATASVGLVAGQVLGGVLVQVLSWRAVFLVNVPVGLTAALLAPRLLGESRQPRAGRRLDVGGAVLITTAALADSLGVDRQSLREALDGGPLAAPAALAKLAKIDAADDTPDFSLRWALKDIDLAVGAAGDRTLPVAGAIGRRWHELVDEGLGDADVSAARHGLGPADLAAAPR